MTPRALLALLIALAPGCQGCGATADKTPAASATADAGARAPDADRRRAPDTSLAAACGAYGSPAKQGKVPPPIDEASGLVVSAFDPSVVWVHNDGSDNHLYAIRTQTGAMLAKVALSGLPDDKRDWEDLAAGPCTPPGAQRCLYVGDIGDNAKSRDAVRVLQLPEPNPNAAPKSVAPSAVARLRFPDKARNCEAMVVDGGAVVWLFSKSKSTLRLYRAPFAAGTQTLTRVAELEPEDHMNGDASRVTAADWDPVGRRLLLRTYDTAWEICAGAAGVAAVATAPWQEVKVADEPQGEAIAYGPGVIWHVSEGGWQRLYRLERGAD